MSDLQKLKELLRERSVRTGHFILSSGKSSSVYVDARLTTMSPEGMKLIGPLSLQLMKQKGWTPDSVGGLTLGADPVAFAISYASVNLQTPLRAFTVRKQTKTHGTGSLIEGPFLPTDDVVIVEDVITTGKSALQAISAVRDTGARILGVLAVVDREEGGFQELQNAGFDVVSLVAIHSLVGAS
jgi:orotate phosphoribosyltransferase